MPTYKLSMIFNVVTAEPGDAAQQRSGGWSESVYDTVLTPNSLAQFREFCLARAALLPGSARIVAIRTQPVDPSGSAQLTSVNFPGNAALNFQTDLPQVALYFNAASAAADHTRKMKLACVPDSQMVRGEFAPTPPYRAALTNYFAKLDGWSMRIRIKDNPRWDIIGIDATGVFSTVQVNTFANGDLATVYSTVAALGGFKRSGNFRVTVDAESVQRLVNWPYGACAKGKIQKAEYTTAVIRTAANNPAVRAAVRKIGRPTTGFRGRRSRSRR